MRLIRPFEFLLAIVATAFCAPGAAQEQANPFARIGHIVVIFNENRSFDHVFGLFPGAEGVNSAQHPPQVDFDGRPLAALPRPRADDRFPRRLPNAPFRLESFVDIDGHTMDPVHDFYLEQEQIDGGKMDRFVEASNAGSLVMGYYDGSELKQWALAKEFVLADHFFHAAFGGSMLARCLGGDKALALVETLFQEQEKWAHVKTNPKQALFDLSKQAGFTEESFDKCLTDQKLFEQLSAVQKRAGDVFGVSATPTIFINGKKLAAPTMEEFDKALGGAPTAAPAAAGDVGGAAPATAPAAAPQPAEGSK